MIDSRSMKKIYLFTTLLMGLNALALNVGEKTTLDLCSGGTPGEISESKADGENVLVLRCPSEKKLYVLKAGYDYVNGEYKKSESLTVIEALSTLDPKSRFFDTNTEIVRVGADVKVIYQKTTACAARAFALQRTAVRKGTSTTYKYNGPVDTGICVSDTRAIGNGPTSIVAMRSGNGSSTVVFDVNNAFLLLTMSSTYDFDNGASPVKITEASFVKKPTLACGQNIEEVHLTADKELLLFQESNKIQMIDMGSGAISLVKDTDYHGASTCHGRSISLYNQRSGSIVVNEKIREIQKVTRMYNQRTQSINLDITTIGY